MQSSSLVKKNEFGKKEKKLTCVKRKKRKEEKNSSTSIGLLFGAAICPQIIFSWNNNMATLTPCENALYMSIRSV